MRHSLLFLFGSLFVVLLTACIDQLDELDDLDEARFNAEYAIPLIDSRITMNDILEDFEEDASLTVDPDGLLRFQYSGDVLTQTSLDIFSSINETLDVLGLIPLVESRQALPFAAPGDLQLDRLQINGATLAYALVNREPVPVTVTLTLPTVELDGQALTVSGNLPGWDGNGNPPVLTNLLSPLDLTGYNLGLEQDSIYIDFTTIDANGNEYEPAAGSALQIQDFSFSYAEGYLGDVTYEGGRDTIEIDFFDNWIQGDVYFEDPTVTFNFENSFGVPTEAVVNVFNIITADGDTLPLESDFITDGGIAFPYPELDQVGEAVTAQFVFDRSNSNIDEVLGSQPVAIDYDVNALTNPTQDTTISGFVTDSSYYRVLVDVELPLYGQAANFVVFDTFALNLTDYDEIDAIEWKVVTENGLPLTVEIQGDFLDASGNVVAQLFPEGETALAAGAPVDADGRPTASNDVTTFVNWEADRVATIRAADRLVLRATFGTTLELEQSVRIENGQELAVRIGAIVSTAND